LQIVPGDIDDYERLARYHYRDSRPGPLAAIFALKPRPGWAGRLGKQSIGVIVYTMPVPSLELRNIATGGFFAGSDRSTQLSLLNKNVRCISRVIIEPRFRALGLATRLVRETMPQMNIPVIEAAAVMGMFNPFFEKAGMKPYTAKPPVRCVRLIEALSMVSVRERELIDPACVQRKLERLSRAEGRFIELEIRRFLQSYGKRRDMPDGLERTRYVLSKLAARPLYYVWFNPNLELSMENYG